MIQKVHLDPNSPSLPSAISSLAHAVTHCKFEATDAVSDEVVLDRILRLLRVCVLSEAGQNALDDKGICEMLEAAFGMCFQGRVSGNCRSVFTFVSLEIAGVCAHCLLISV